MVHRKKTGYWRKQGGRSGLEISLANKISALVTGQRCSAGLWRRSLLMISAGRDGARRLVTSCLAKIMPCNMHLNSHHVVHHFLNSCKMIRMLQPWRSKGRPRRDDSTHTTSKRQKFLSASSSPVKPAEPDGRIDRFTHAFKPS